MGIDGTKGPKVAGSSPDDAPDDPHRRVRDQRPANRENRMRGAMGRIDGVLAEG